MTEVATNPVADRLKLGPREGVNYPLIVQYCGNCSMPIEVSPFNKLVMKSLILCFNVFA